MRDPYRIAMMMTLSVSIVCSAVIYSTAQDRSAPQSKSAPSPDNSRLPDSSKGTTGPQSGPNVPPGEPTITVLDHRDVQGVLGKEVRSSADEDMGRIVDVIVDHGGQARAAIIDFGGFLGVGSRKVAVAWNALHFPSESGKPERVGLELARDQVRAAPEYKPGQPLVVLGASGSLESLPFP